MTRGCGTLSRVSRALADFPGAEYACGIAGEDIPLGARIVGFADSVDALTHDRRHRRGPDSDAAPSEFRRRWHQSFDPRVVDALLALRPPHEEGVCA